MIPVSHPCDALDVEHHASLLREAKLLMYLDGNVNVLRLIGVTTKQMEKGKLYVYFEVCEFGSLHDYLTQRRKIFKTLQGDTAEQNGKPELMQALDFAQQKKCSSSNYSKPIEFREDEQLNELDLVWYAYQTASGLEYLASKYIIHRDIALRNVFLTGDQVVKIADFGLARCNQQCYKSKTDRDMPIKWMALESLLQDEYTKQSDVWSFGIVVWEIFTMGDVPYPGVDVKSILDLLKAGIRMQAPYICPQQVYELMRKCWSKDAASRPSFGECKSVLSQTGWTLSSVKWTQLTVELVNIAERSKAPVSAYSVRF